MWLLYAGNDHSGQIPFGSNPKPTRDEIKKALQPHICRCTGYQKIFEAVELAASYFRRETKSIKLKLEGKNTIGKSVTRRDALEKATGTTLYAADLAVEGCAHIKVLRSPHHHAKIIHIDKAEAEAIPGVLAVLTAQDVKGTNILKMAGDDQPILCGNKVRFIGDPVAAVVATSEEVASHALEKIEVTYEPLEPVLTPEEALKEMPSRSMTIAPTSSSSNLSSMATLRRVFQKPKLSSSKSTTPKPLNMLIWKTTLVLPLSTRMDNS